MGKINKLNNQIEELRLDINAEPNLKNKIELVIQRNRLTHHRDYLLKRKCVIRVISIAVLSVLALLIIRST